MVDVPAWARDAVFYQVFPDRFAASPRVPKPGALEPWDAPPTHDGFKGGDLLGIAERLDELMDLGINALYLNPVFAAASNHRYNTYDYLAVDPLLGGEAALRELVDAAHARGVRVMLDGVFNHVGRGFWAFHHVLEAGGWSPYRDWFHLDADVLAGRQPLNAYGPTPPPRGYRSWWDVPSLPKLRVEHPAVREHLFDVAEHWLRFGVDGWRLDVPQDIEDPTFWPAFRRRVKAVNPDAYLVGEVWDEAPDWVSGDRFDALMNYPLGMTILGFVGGPAIDATVTATQANYSRSLVPLDGGTFAAVVERLLSSHEPAVSEVQFNLIGSHDTPRARTVLGGSTSRLRLATLLQLVLPGAPSIYYGDEVAMEGAADPDNRRAYPPAGATLDDDAVATRAFVGAAVRARHAHVALRRGTVRTIASGPRWVALERTAEGHRAIVAINPGAEATAIELGDAATGLRPLAVPGLEGSFASAAIRLPPLGGIVLVDDA